MDIVETLTRLQKSGTLTAARVADTIRRQYEQQRPMTERLDDALADEVIRDNADWLYLPGDGWPPVVTPEGKRYAALIAEADALNLGILAQHDYAMRKLGRICE